jgi:hypothetical protein
MSMNEKRPRPLRVERFLSKAELEKERIMWRKHDEAFAKVMLRARGKAPRKGQKLDLPVRD